MVSPNLPTEDLQRFGGVPGTRPPQPTIRRGRRRQSDVPTMPKGSTRPPRPGLLPALPEGLTQLPAGVQPPVEVSGVEIQPIPEGDERLLQPQELERYQQIRERLRRQLREAHSISGEETLNKDGPGYDEALDRDTGWVLRAADWIQRNIDQPIPGFMSFSVAMLADPKKNPIEDVADVFEYLFTGDNTEAERILKKVGVDLPTESPKTVAEGLVQSWKVFGEYQDKRPELFPMEKFVEELLLSPANLIPIGALGKTAFKTVGRPLGINNGWSWLARKMRAGRFSGLFMTNTGRSAAWEQGFEEATGILFDSKGKGMKGQAASQGKNPRLAAQEMIRRLKALRDEQTEDLDFLGSWTQQERVKEFRDVLRKIDIDFELFAEDMVIGKKFTPVGLKHDILSTIKRVAAGGDTWEVARGKRQKFLSLTQGGNKIPKEMMDELKVDLGKVKPNIAYRGTQALKGAVYAPLMLGMIPRWLVNNITSNTMMMMTTLDGHFMTKVPRILLMSGKAGAKGLKEGITGVKAPRPRYAGERWGAPKIPFVEEGMGMAREAFGKTEVPLSWDPVVNAGIFEKVPFISTWIKTIMRSNFAVESQMKAATWDKLFSGYATREWKDNIKNLQLPKDLQARLLAFTDEADFDGIMRELGEGVTAISPKRLVPVNNIQDPLLQRLMKEHLDQLPDDINADDLAEGILSVGEDYVRYMEDAADSLVVMGNDLEASAGAWSKIEARALDDIIKDAPSAEAKAGYQKIKDAQGIEDDSFIRDLRSRWKRVEDAQKDIANSAGIQQSPLLARMQEEIQNEYLRSIQRTHRITNRYYADLKKLSPADIDGAKALQKARTIERTQSTEDYAKAVEDLAVDFKRLVAEHGLEGDIPIDALMASKKISDVQFRGMLEEAGLDPRLFADDVPPDISILLRTQRQRVMKQLDETMGDFRSAMDMNTEALRTAARRGMPEEEVLAVRRLFNEVRGRSSVRATERTEEAFFNYPVRNRGDFLLNHFAPFPFWATRYMTTMLQRSVEEPRTARAILRILGEWTERVQDDPVEARFSMSTGIKTEGGSLVRFNPLYALMPLGSPAISMIQFGADWNDLSQAMADVSDFMGSYLYPHADLVGSALDGVLGLERTGGVGMVRDPKEVALDFSPITGLAVTGMNAWGLDIFGDALVTDRNKGKVIQAMGYDLDLGKLSKSKVKEAVHSIQIGKPNALAAIYAKKALSRKFWERTSGLLGLPFKLIPPELDEVERSRAWMYKRPKAHPFMSKGTPSAMHPEIARLQRSAYPSLEVVSGQRTPVGLTRDGERVFTAVQELFRGEDKEWEDLDKELTGIIARFNDPNDIYGSADMWDDRRAAYALTVNRIDAGRERAREAAEREGLPELPIKPEERQLFWEREGREVYPVHPLRLAWDGYQAIEADLFREDPRTRSIDFEAFSEAKEAYLSGISDDEKEYILRRMNDPTKPDADVRRATEILKPYWDVRRELLELPEFSQADQILQEIRIAEKRGDFVMSRWLGQAPVLQNFERRVENEKLRLRSRDPILEHYVVKYTSVTIPIRTKLMERQR